MTISTQCTHIFVLKGSKKFVKKWNISVYQNVQQTACTKAARTLKLYTKNKKKYKRNWKCNSALSTLNRCIHWVWLPHWCFCYFCDIIFCLYVILYILLLLFFLLFLLLSLLCAAVTAALLRWLMSNKNVQTRFIPRRNRHFVNTMSVLVVVTATQDIYLAQMTYLI